MIQKLEIQLSDDPRLHSHFHSLYIMEFDVFMATKILLNLHFLDGGIAASVGFIRF